jgi:(p)ppGpp synthase/HD superfamily hydrolase
MPDIKEITPLLVSPTSSDLALIQKAYDFANTAHQGQERKNGEPYFNHLFATAKNIAELGMGATTIAAGFLHDTIEIQKSQQKISLRSLARKYFSLLKVLQNSVR